MHKIFWKLLLVLGMMFFLRGLANSENGLTLMKVEHGARQAGMGAAFVSVTDDPNGAAYNPATIVSISKFIASLGHTAYWENVRLESGYFAVNLSTRTFLHGGIRFAVVDKLEQRQSPTPEPDNLFDAHDISFKSGMTYRFSDKLSVGFSMGWFIEKIEAWRGSAFNVDFGLLVRPTDNINIGAAAINIGSDFNLSKPGVIGSRDISLPTTYTIGGSYKYQKHLGALDIVILDNETHIHLGGETQLHELFWFRAGYKINYDSKNITAGASFTKRNLTVDYAFVPYTNELGTSHMFVFTFSL